MFISYSVMLLLCCFVIYYVTCCFGVIFYRIFHVLINAVLCLLCCVVQYVRCLYVYNKIDTLSIEEVDELARKPDSVVISIYMNLNIDTMLQQMWKFMGLIRIYTKRRGQPPDLDAPVVLSAERDGLTVAAVCKSISKELLEIFNFALVWGKSTKYNPQRVGSTHVLSDEDVVQIVPKTLVQQKQSKDYRARVMNE